MTHIIAACGHATLPLLLGYTWGMVALSILSKANYGGWINVSAPLVLILSFAVFFCVFLFFFFTTLPWERRGNCIYILRRDDGTIKIGRTNNLLRRMSEHEADYNQSFTLIFHWETDRPYALESLALTITDRHFFREGQRRELRKLSHLQCLWLIFMLSALASLKRLA